MSIVNLKKPKLVPILCPNCHGDVVSPESHYIWTADMPDKFEGGHWTCKEKPVKQLTASVDRV